MAVFCFGLSTIRIKSWVGTCKPGETSGSERRRKAAGSATLHRRPCGGPRLSGEVLQTKIYTTRSEECREWERSGLGGAGECGEGSVQVMRLSD